MGEIEKINETELTVKVYQGQRVVTFKDIDTVHERPEGTARKRFNDNKKHFIEGEDYFVRKTDEAQKEFGIAAPNGLTLLTESGYLMLVKSFTDDLAWDVQRKLVKGYFRKAHNVKQLTITSRDITTITTKKNCHARVIMYIKDCIKELSDMGFNTEDFFIPSSYIGANNREGLQYLCTEKGCEYYAGKLEPEARKNFISEFKDRFERMRNALEGKAVKKPPMLINMADVEEKEPLIRLYKTNNEGIVLINNEVYNLTPEETDTLSRFIPELQDKGIGHIQYIISAFLKSMKTDGRLEEVAAWGVKQDEPQGADITKKKAKEKESIDLNNVETLSTEQAKLRYGLGYEAIQRAARECNAIVRMGGRRLYSRRKLDKYFESLACNV